MTELKDLTIEEFAKVTASDAPAPGGGSVAAAAGSLAAALAEMVANLTIGKEKYAEAENEMRELAGKGQAVREKLIADIQRDSSSFNLYMAALRMPKDTEEEKTARREAMQRGLKEAAMVPLSVAETAAEIFPLAEAAVARGNANAVTDGLVSAMMARTAVLSALLNVKINLNSIKDEAFRADMEKQVKRLEKTASEYEAKILKSSELSPEI
ncbi:MAG: cyclodeaminase/cyclohydrolase family protein [Clostridium sp.]|nr:cyclodeaminase/cyclohydrolase family protein [Clostridium sp.]MEE1496929.1 cyclodeaminase/cyclohydrolase family protein [Clostridium sp.]